VKEIRGMIKQICEGKLNTEVRKEDDNEKKMDPTE